ILAGLPTTNERGGIIVWADTKLNAPTIDSLPITASSMITLFIPINTLLPICEPCIIAPCPICAFASKCTVVPGNMCIVQFSCTLQPSAIITAPQSPRIAQPGPTYTSLPITTLPVIQACGCIKEEGCITGTKPLKEYIIAYR